MLFDQIQLYGLLGGKSVRIQPEVVDDFEEECLGNFVSPGAFFFHLGDETGGDGVCVAQLAQQSVDVERIEALPKQIGEGREMQPHVNEAV